ncbi:MAG: phage tail protein [Bacteroidetes bacterium]|nr:phage tail protein [Bacteroidota bacterium]
MAENGPKESSAVWPLVTFKFSVTIGNDELVFQEVTGLASETQVIEYRAGNNAAFSTVKMPGIKKYGNVTLKKGVFKSDKSMWAMYNAVKMNTIARKTVTICLLDESNAPAMTWKLSNAFPVKMTVTDMNSDSNEAAVETMELAYEGLAIV